MKLRDGNACTEWRDVLMKKKKITENQIDILNAVGSEQKERAKRVKNVILFGVSMSTAATEEERTKEDEKTICDILDEIGISKAEQELAMIKRFKENPNKTAKQEKMRISSKFQQTKYIVYSLLHYF